MNIFATSSNPYTAALDHCFVHQRKMIVEYAQLMSAAHKEWGTWTSEMYKPTHENHPSARWTRLREGNYQYVYDLFYNLLALYQARTGKQHASSRLLDVLNIHSTDKPKFNWEMLAMPFEYKQANVHEAYQSYLCAKFSEWQSRDKPIAVEFERVPSWYVQNYEMLAG